MKRTEIIQNIINRINARTYLEIGVSRGSNFFPIKAQRKIGVDTHFNFGIRKMIKWYCKNIYNLWAQFHEMDSDSFFAQNRLVNGIDVAFIDGLHTYEQSLKDVVNSLNYLNQGGVIIMHDCNPRSEDAACPAIYVDPTSSSNPQSWNILWNGDVWKTICHIRSTYHDLNVFVLDCDQGLGIISRGYPEGMLSLTHEQIENMTYSDMAKDRNMLLNLKDKYYLFNFLDSA